MKEHVFLVEIGTDELPPKILKKLGIDFSSHIRYEFKKNNIRYDSVNWFAAPRHLAIKSNILIVNQTLFDMNNHDYDYSNCFNNNQDLSNQKINKNNPNISINNDLKLCKFYKRNLLKTDSINNQDFKNLLLKIINNALSKLINYEMMHWGGISIPFIRPVNTVTVLLDSYLITGRFFGINIDRILYGHRHIKNNKIILNHANDYPDILMTKGCVIVDYNIRKETIRIKVEKQAEKLGGIVDMRDDNFLEEITSLIEWPIVLFGRFDKRFLTLPSEVIIYIMKQHQKYFPVYNIIDGMLLPCFIFIINTVTDNYKKIITGHENIIRTRFMDAEFFLKNDSRYRLEDYIPKLNSIIFHSQLGSLRNKVDRISELSGWIANQIHEDIIQAKRAGYLCKCDLMSDMVLEFPEVQGIIGMHYARRDGESEKVALAQKEHYQPKNATDILPTEQISCIVAIADKMDTISGIFGIKDFPTGSRDPFSLKRNAIGILNIIIQKEFPLNLSDLIHQSVILYGSNLTDTIIIENNIYNFMYKRLCLCYFSQGYTLKIIKSVLNAKLYNIKDCTNQINSVNNFYKLQKKECIKLHLIYKRISNILKKQNISVNDKIIQTTLLKVPEEIELFKQTIKIEKKIKFLFNKKNYSDVLLEIVNISNLTNNFLDNVLVLDENLNTRFNRLTLLNVIKNLILKVIDISYLI